MTFLACLVLTAKLLTAATPEFNPQEPISLDLKDASITDVITMLGALANVPVSIAPDVTGSISVQVADLPYAKVLELIGQQNQLAIRFEGGKLVATRSAVPLPATGSAVPAPAAVLRTPRLSVDAYAAAARAWKALAVRVRGRKMDVCSAVDFDNGHGYEIPFPASSESATVTQFGWDPVTGTRFVAVEMPSGGRRVLALKEGQGLLLEPSAQTASPDTASAPCIGGVATPLPARRSPSNDLTLRMQVTEPNGEPVLAPQIRASGGDAFTMRSGLMGVVGQHDEIVVFGYLARDGKSAAAAIQATAIRTDPKDGREYVYSETSPAESIRFTAVGTEPVTLVTLPGGAGSIRYKPLELRATVASDH